VKELNELYVLVSSLRGTNSRTEKEAILRRHTDCKALLFYAYNSFYQYGVTSASCAKGDMWKDIADDEMHSLVQLLEHLRTREITGDIARAHCRRFAESLPPKIQDVFWNIIDRDLKCRIDVKIINKVFPGLIPTFDVALAESLNDCPNVNIFDGSWFASRKLDGVRVLALIDDKVRFMSRKGQEFKSLKVLKASIDALPVDLSGYVLDGEMCIMRDGKEDFREAVSQIRRNNFIIAHPRYKVFDILTMKEFMAGRGSDRRPLSKRLENLKDIVDPSGCIEVLEQTPVTEESYAALLKESEVNGWEGLILRRDVPYVGKRSKDMLKVKKFHEAEYVVEGIQLGTKHIMDPNTELMEEQEVMARAEIRHKGNLVGVGSGWTDQQRLRYRKNPKEIIGKTITVSYFEESTDADGKISLRFPTVRAVHGKQREV